MLLSTVVSMMEENWKSSVKYVKSSSAIKEGKHHNHHYRNHLKKRLYHRFKETEKIMETMTKLLAQFRVEIQAAVKAEIHESSWTHQLHSNCQLALMPKLIPIKKQLFSYICMYNHNILLGEPSE